MKRTKTPKPFGNWTRGVLEVVQHLGPNASHTNIIGTMSSWAHHRWGYSRRYAREQAGKVLRFAVRQGEVRAATALYRLTASGSARLARCGLQFAGEGQTIGQPSPAQAAPTWRPQRGERVEARLAGGEWEPGLCLAAHTGGCTVSTDYSPVSGQVFDWADVRKPREKVKVRLWRTTEGALGASAFSLEGPGVVVEVELPDELGVKPCP